MPPPLPLFHRGHPRRNAPPGGPKRELPIPCCSPTLQLLPIRSYPPPPSARASQHHHARAPAAEALLSGGLRAESLPRHVAVVMDGNARGLLSAAGHEAGCRALEETVRLSHALTAFAFSKENWSRPKVEVDFLMRLFERVIRDSVAEFLREGIRLRVIGDCSRLSVSLQKIAREAEEATRNNSQLDLILAISYSGRRDIVQACRNLAQKVHGKLLRPEDITSRCSPTSSRPAAQTSSLTLTCSSGPAAS